MTEVKRRRILPRGKDRKKQETTPAAILSGHERKARRYAAPPRWASFLNYDVMRRGRARGHIKRVAEITGETPIEIMDRLRLTESEIEFIGPWEGYMIWD